MRDSCFGPVRSKPRRSSNFIRPQTRRSLPYRIAHTQISSTSLEQGNLRSNWARPGTHLFTSTLAPFTGGFGIASVQLELSRKQIGGRKTGVHRSGGRMAWRRSLYTPNLGIRTPRSSGVGADVPGEAGGCARVARNGGFWGSDLNSVVLGRRNVTRVSLDLRIISQFIIVATVLADGLLAARH